MLLKVAVDATPLLGQPTGIGRYVGHLLERLAVHPHLDVRAFALTGRSPESLAAVLPAGIRRPTRGLPAAVVTRTWQHSDHPRIAPFVGGRVDVVHGTNFVTPPAASAVVTVHDLTSLRYPELCTPATRRYPDLVARAIRRGALVQTPSRAVADEVIEHFDVDPDRVVAVHHGVAVRSGEPSNPSEPPYLLAVGTIEPRKDYPTLLLAFDAVAGSHPDLRLRIAGAVGWQGAAFESTLAGLTHKDRVDVLGYVSEEERVRLMRGAAVFVYPSLYEGFGLPPLEAMASGVPVVATRTTVAHEILADAALLADVGDIDELASMITTAVGDTATRARLVTAGSRNIERFSWDACADGVVELYRRAAQR